MKREQRKISELQIRVDAFKKELAEVCQKHKLDIRAKISPYGPVLEIFEMPALKVENIGDTVKEQN